MAIFGPKIAIFLAISSGGQWGGGQKFFGDPGSGGGEEFFGGPGSGGGGGGGAFAPPQGVPWGGCGGV